MRKIIFFLSFFFCFLQAYDKLDMQIKAYEHTSDLSHKTKKESVGHVSVLTRLDIDSLKLKTLKELLNYVRFTSYSETATGLLDPFYTTYNPSVNEDALKIYIDDQALYLPYFGSGMQIFGKINLNFIDHAEIYWGVPSFNFGISTGYNVIKLYSKNPNRENISTLNFALNNHSSSIIDGYSSYMYEDFGYMLSLSYENIKQQKVYHDKNFPLKRDFNDMFLYTKFYFKNHSLTFNALKAKYNSFINFSETFTPLENYTKVKNLYLAYNYENFENKFYIAYQQGMNKAYDKGSPLINFQDSFFINEIKSQTLERMLDFHFSHKFLLNENEITLGLRSRYKNFKIKQNEINSINYTITNDYNREITFSGYVEAKYLFDDKNLLVGSLKLDKFWRNGGVKNTNAFSSRIGFVHNGDTWFNKTFLLYSNGLENYYQFLNSNITKFSTLSSKNSSTKAFNTEFGVNINKASLALTYGILYSFKDVELDSMRSNLYSLTFKYNFDVYNKIRSAFWVLKDSYAQNTYQNENKKLKKGAYFTLFNTYEKFDFANSAFYYDIDTSDKHFYTFDSTITYNANKNLQLYIKAKNLFNDKLTQKFIKHKNNANNDITMNEFSMYERVFWFGFEYSF